MSLLITGARLPDGTVTDLYVCDQRLHDPADAPPGTERLDADGLVALPGLVDLDTHLREPGREDAETVASATRAAARGGYTAVLAAADTTPVTDTGEAAAHVLDLGRGAAAQVVPVGAVTRGRAGTDLAELGTMNARAAVTVFSDSPACVVDAGLMRRALEYVAAFGGVVAQHAQDPGLAGPSAVAHEGTLSGRLGLAGWPAEAESTIVARDVQLARLTGSRLHVRHVSSAETVAVLRWAKDRGIPVTAEVSPHHLWLTEREIESYDPVFKVNPPLRGDEDVAALREALADGTIDAVATDHSPWAPHDKDDHAFGDARPGVTGLEQALAVVMETMLDRLGWAGVAERMSYAPARIAGLVTQGRPLEVGAPATLVLVDPTARAVVDPSASASLARNNPYGGRDLPDPVVATLWEGRLTYRR